MKNFWYMLGADSYWTNGYLHQKNPAHMPGVKCNHCGETWGDFRYHPMRIPSAARKLLEKTRSPLTVASFEVLKSKILQMGGEGEVKPGDLLPGASFLPENLESSVAPPGFFTMADQLFVSSEAFAEHRAGLHLSDVSTRTIPLLFKGGVYQFDIIIPKSFPIIPRNWEISSSCSLCGYEEWDRGKFDDDFSDTLDILAATYIGRKSLIGISIAPLVTTCYFIVCNELKVLIERLNSEVQFVPVQIID